MKNLNFTFKSIVRSKARWLLTIFAILTIGVGQMWGTARTFKSGEKIYFKDASGNITWGSLNCLWKVANGDIFAYFWNDTENAWSTSASLSSGTINGTNAIYEITVPGSGKEYTKVLFTRHPNGVTPSFSNRWNQTENQTPDVGYNMFCISNDGSYDSQRDPNHLWKGTWSRYAKNPALVGSFNGWNPDANVFTDYSDNKGKTFITLPASTGYEFKVLVGESMCGVGSGTITSTITDWWHLNGANNVGLTTDEAGEYAFQWNKSTYYLGVYYPKARFTKNQVYYFDASQSGTSYWNSALFSSKFYFRYYDTEGNVDEGQMCVAANAIGSKSAGDGPVYYKNVGNNSLVGSVIVDRYNTDGSARWGENSTQAAHGYDRASPTQNCFYINQASSWDPTVAWKTYCPPTTSESFTDNSTPKISWQDAGNDGSTSGKAILVKTGTTLKVTASASKAVADGNMTVKYDFKVNSGSVTANTTGTYTSTASTNNTSYDVQMQAYTNYNLDNTKNSTKSTAKHLYYKALDTYTVTNSLTNMSSDGRSGDDAAAYNIAYTATLSAADGYNLPATITVARGATTLTAGTHYTYNSSTGALSINANQVTDNITITAAGVEKTYAISYAAGTYGSGSLSGGSKRHFSAYTLSDNSTAFTRDDYVYDGWSTNVAGSSKDYNLGGSYTTNSAQTFYPHWVPAYNVTHTLSHVTTSSGATGAKAAVNGVAYVATFTADAGYALPSDVTVTVGGATKTKGTHYTWSVSAGVGTLTVLAANVTGAIVVSITGEPVTLTFVTENGYWNSTANWSPACVPTIAHNVVLQKAAQVNVKTAQAKSVRIDHYGSYTGKLVIKEQAGLVVAEDILAKHKSDGSYEATSKEDLQIRTDNTGNGGLITGSECAHDTAEYVFYTKAYKYTYLTKSYYINQYIGIPFVDMYAYQLYGFNIFVYDGTADDWRTPGSTTLQAWDAYNLIRKYSSDDWSYFYLDGILNLPGKTGTKTFTCGWRATDRGSIDEEDGHQDYLFANSWTAPISIKDITSADCSGTGGADLVQNIYIFNAGYVGDGQKTLGDYAGTWSTFPLASSAYMDGAVIPATQAFMVTSKKGSSGATLTLDYEKHVYDPATAGSGMNTSPTRAPRREQTDDAPNVLKIVVSNDSVNADQLYLFEREDFSYGFDDGWDGHKVPGLAFAAQLYAINGASQMAVNAVPDMNGIGIGFKAGVEASEYTFSFEYADDAEPIYLYDFDTQVYTLISNEATYTFTTSDKDEHARFAITRNNAPQIATDFEQMEAGMVQHAEKFLKNDMLFIRRGGKIYNAEGILVK